MIACTCIMYGNLKHFDRVGFFYHMFTDNDTIFVHVISLRFTESDISLIDNPFLQK